jgi:hypothetical protein
MDFNNDHTKIYWTKLPPETNSLGANYSPLMVESKEEMLVKEER